MKAYILILLVLLLTACSQTTDDTFVEQFDQPVEKSEEVMIADTIECIDTDKGKKELKKGETCVDKDCMTDTCVLDHGSSIENTLKCPEGIEACKVKEFYCSNDEIQNELITCPEGCSLGKCLTTDPIEEKSIEIRAFTCSNKFLKTGDTATIILDLEDDEGMSIGDASVFAQFSGPDESSYKLPMAYNEESEEYVLETKSVTDSTKLGEWTVQAIITKEGVEVVSDKENFTIGASQ